MKIIAGLGNPGKEYEHTRHNMGFDVIDELARRWNVTLWKEDMKAEIGQVVVKGEKVLLVKPLTYMNNSGEAVGAIARYYKVDLDNIYIICDDLDLPPGKTRIRKRVPPADITVSNPSSPIWAARTSTASASAWATLKMDTP